MDNFSLEQGFQNFLASKSKQRPFIINNIVINKCKKHKIRRKTNMDMKGIILFSILLTVFLFTVLGMFGVL